MAKIKAPCFRCFMSFPTTLRSAANGAIQRMWWMVNPNHGRSITIDRLMQDFDGAQAAGEQEIRRWASQHLNIEMGLRSVPIDGSAPNTGRAAQINQLTLRYADRTVRRDRGRH